MATALRSDRDTRIEIFAEIRRLAILKTNTEQSKAEIPKYERERNQGVQENLISCSSCKAMISRRSMARHAHLCIEGNSYPISMGIFGLENQDLDSDFHKQVLNGLRDDTCGNYILKDKWLLCFGRYVFTGKNKDPGKIVETVKTVRNQMRQLSRLFIELQTLRPVFDLNKNIIDLFHHRNHENLMKAVNNLSMDHDKNLKHGLKLGLYFTILSAAKFFHAFFLQQEKDELTNQLDKFVRVLKMNEPLNFGDARFKMEQQRQRVSRKPHALPLEEDLEVVRKSLMSTIKAISDLDMLEITIQDYVKLRNATCTRLTLLNARRGGEPSRLLLEHLEEGLKDSWIHQSNLVELDPLEKKLLDQIKICYQSGKGGKRLVPLLLPNDTLKALEIIKNKYLRNQFKISPSNMFVFAPINTEHKSKQSHLDGSSALKESLKDLQLSNASRINATANRHYVSTIYATLHVTDPRERHFFYEHLGHDSRINQDNYQCPPALMTVTKVGKRLLDFESGMSFCSIKKSKYLKKIKIKPWTFLKGSINKRINF